MFWRKRQEVEVVKEPEKVRYAEYDMLGFEHDDPSRYGDGKANVAYGILSATRIHTAIFGLVGSGKSSILKLLILQNIQKKEGFMVLDPHGELARTVMSLIPKSMQDDVIYINPASLYNFQRTVQINPLEVRKEEERYVVVMSFVNALYNLYRESWGPRLETVLRNAANALVETEKYNTLGSIRQMITDKEARDMFMRCVSSENVRHFWTEVFEKQYSKDAGSAAYNKIDKIMATPAIAAMLDTTKSSIQIADIIRENKMIIVDLSTGASDDIASFVGTILLNMLYVEAKKRIDLEVDMAEITKNPFYVYVDEAHMFSNYTMSEMLRALRKFGIKMTIATQTVNAYDTTFAAEIGGVCQTIICGKCDANTAQAVNVNMGASKEELQELQNHTFAFSSAEAGVPVSGVFKSRPIPAADQKVRQWTEVARHSLNNWGEAVSLRKYMSQSIVRRMDLSPLETAILHLLYYEKREMDKTAIREAIEPLFGEIKTADLMTALVNVLEHRMRYITGNSVITDDGDKNLVMRYSVSTKAFETYFSWATRGQRAGSDQHIATMKMIADQQMRQGHYCRPDLGDEGQSLPDIVIVEPETVDHKGKPVFSQGRWNERTALAVEVETDPTKHRNQIYKNWKKNFDEKCHVWFVVFSDRHKAAITEILDSHDVPSTDYETMVFPKEILTPGHGVMVELPHISFHKNITDNGLVEKPLKVAPPLSAVEYEMWKALDTEKWRTYDDVTAELMTGVDADESAITKAFLTLSAKRVIKTNNGRAVRDKDVSAIYDKMIRDRKPVVEAAPVSAVAARPAEPNPVAAKPAKPNVPAKKPTNLEESQKADLRLKLEQMTEQQLFKITSGQTNDNDAVEIAKAILTKRGWTV